jgi:hypothetical protein
MRKKSCNIPIAIGIEQAIVLIPEFENDVGRLPVILDQQKPAILQRTLILPIFFDPPKSLKHSINT